MLIDRYTLWATQFKNVDAISAMEIYHTGDELIVEVDVCLPPKTPLHTAHDIGCVGPCVSG